VSRPATGRRIDVRRAEIYEGGARAFTPMDLAPLVWLRDSFVTTPTKVSSWDDISGNGNHFTQAVDAARPTYNASDANFNGQPTCTFAGAQVVERALTLGVNALTVFVCARRTTAGARTHIGNNSAARMFVAYTDASILTGAAGFDQVTYTDDALNTKVRKADLFDFANAAGSLPLIYRDNALVTTATASNTATNTTAVSATYYVGAASAAFASAFLGQMAELIVVPRLCTVQEIANVYTYQLARFGA
jgi:hypothetical protein